MKPVLLLLHLVIFIYPALSQTVAVQHDKENVLYIGVDNPITVVVEGYSCEALIVSTDNGSISGKNGHYIVRPDHPDPNTKIIVKVKTDLGIKELSGYFMRSKYLPVKSK